MVCYSEMERICESYSDMKEGMNHIMTLMEAIAKEQKKIKEDIITIALKMDAMNIENDELFKVNEELRESIDSLK